jgi:serine/threonine-protein kinase
VKVRPDGTVKILDFGLAKALEDTPAAGSINTSPTISAAATREGIILGTAAYMSPEQARGKVVDRRCDIWSFGAVLFEILSEKQAFAGEDVSHTLAAVIMKEPDWDALPAATPARIQGLVRRCLNKDPRQRLRDIGEARIAIEESLVGSTGGTPVVVHGQDAHATWRRALPWALAAVSTFVLVALTIGIALRTPRPATRPIARLVINLPSTDRLALGKAPVVSLSPDGSRLVYVASHSGTTQLYLRSIDRFEATPILGTEDAQSRSFRRTGSRWDSSPRGKLKTVFLSGGAPLTLCSAFGGGASWGADGSIIFARGYSGLFRVSAAGGTPKPLTALDRKKGEITHIWPEILPGSKAVVFTMWSGSFNLDDERIGVLSLKTGEQRVLVEGGAYARYVPSGHLVYAGAGGLLAVPFDLKRLEVGGPPVSILKGVSMQPDRGGAEFSLSSDGSLAYVPGGSSLGDRTLVWVDRKGAARSLAAPPRWYFCPRLSPDAQRLAVSIQGNRGTWLYDLARDTLTRLASGNHSIWTPDGRYVTFGAFESESGVKLYRIPADGSGAAERLTTSEKVNVRFPGSWSPDGQVLAFTQADPTTGWDIWMLGLQGDRKPQPFLQTPSHEGGPMFSPDGRWLAYLSNESGRNEIYVRPFPGPGGKMQISTEGGVEPVWARNGRELFYRNGDKMMVTAVETKPMFAPAKPKLLFEAHYETASPFEPDYEVSPDGQRFLMIKASEQESAATQLNVVLNWSDELRRLAPAGKP